MTESSQSGMEALTATLRNIVGPDNVIVDLNERIYFSQDYYKKVDPVALVIRPTSVEALALAVKHLSEADVAMYPRGGGYSYTDAYLPTRSPGVCIDTQALNNIVHVNEQDMYVTAEAGCTWEKLDSHLATLGLRTPFMGPQSGLNATLGGGVSQGSVSIGSGKYGPSGESVLSLDVVLADGTIIKTGSAAQGQRPPFFRHYGPDLTGLFCNDAGALGIKARVTLRLQKRKPMVHGLSFGFQSFEDMAKGMGAVARLNVATENMGLTHTALTNATTQGFSEDLRIFLHGTSASFTHRRISSSRDTTARTQRASCAPCGLP
jgi:FAD/FMN-containing dehydrogenase